MGGNLGKDFSAQIFAELLTTSLQFFQSKCVSLNANFLNINDDILEWEATQPLETFLLNFSIIDIRYIKAVIHYLVNNVHADLFLVGHDGCNQPLVIWVGPGSASISGSFLPGIDLVLEPNGNKFTRVNRTLWVALGRNIVIR